MPFNFLYDPDQKDFVKLELLPALGNLTISQGEYSPENVKNIQSPEAFLLYLSDVQLKEFLLQVQNQDVAIAVLPHPEAKEACRGMGVDTNLTKAVDHLKNDPSPVKADVLMCNGHPVFHSVVVGHTFKLASESASNGKFWGKRLSFITRFFRIRPFMVNIELSKEKKLTTAVAGIVISEHRRSSFISGMVLDESHINDGKLHAFFLSPRSISEMLIFAIRSVFVKKHMPSFGGQIRSESMLIKFTDGPQTYLVDREQKSSEELQLSIAEKQISIYPGEHLTLPEENSDTADIYKVAPLPTGEAAEALAEHSLPLIRNASTEEFKELFNVLRKNSLTSNTYLVLMVLSTIIATFGLFANSSPVVIGAMILAPLMSPIVSLSMGALRQEKKLILDSAKTIIAGLVFSMVFAIILTWLTPITTPSEEILSRTRPNLLDLGIAVFSGIAGAYAHAREEVAKTLAGVAIAVALIPPLAVASIGAGWADSSIFLGASLLLLTNLAGMVLAASATFMLMGFSPLRLAAKGMFITLVMVLALSIPLALGFKQMIDEHKIIVKLEAISTEYAIIKDVKVQNLDPLKVSLKIVSDYEVNEHQIDQIKDLIEEEAETPVQLEVITVISR